MSSPRSLPATAATADLDDIRRRLEAAENAWDAASICDVMADDIVLMVPDFPVQEGKTTCTAFVHDIIGWQREHLQRHIDYTSAEIQIAGPMAFDRGTFMFTVAPKAGGSTEEVHGKYLWLYSRDDAGAWKIARVIMSLDSGGEDATQDSDPNG